MKLPAVVCLMTLVLACSAAMAAAEKEAQPPSASWEETVQKALDRPLGNVSWKDAPLPDVLATLGKAAGAAVVLDAAAVAEPEKVRITLAVPKEGEMTLRSALGNVLKLAGLRYTLRDQAIFVSTSDRLVAELLAGDAGPEPAVPGVNTPMTEGDALAATVDFYDGSEEFLPVSIMDFTRGPVDARFEKPAYRDAQGRLHFPGPPMILQDPNIFDPYRRFSRSPWFLRPPYLAPMYWGPENQPMTARSDGDTETLKALLEYMRRNPDTTVGQLLQQLEAGQLKK